MDYPLRSPPDLSLVLKTPLPPARLSSQALKETCKRGDLQTLQEIYAQVDWPCFDRFFFDKILEYSCLFAQREIVYWLFSFDNDHEIVSTAFVEACVSDDLAFISELRLYCKQICKFSLSECNQKLVNKGLEKAAESTADNRDIIVNWLIRCGANNWTAAIYAACRGGHEKLVDLFFQRGKKTVTVEDSKMFVCSCAGGNVDLVKRFWHHESSIDQGYQAAYEQGHVQVCQYLFTVTNVTRLPPLYLHNFYQIVRNGHENVLDWIMSKPFNMSLHYRLIEGMYGEACRHGQKKIADKLHGMLTQPIAPRDWMYSLRWSFLGQNRELIQDRLNELILHPHLFDTHFYMSDTDNPDLDLKVWLMNVGFQIDLACVNIQIPVLLNLGVSVENLRIFGNVRGNIDFFTSLQSIKENRAKVVDVVMCTLKIVLPDDLIKHCVIGYLQYPTEPLT
jgi:hypothetical protein